MLPLDFWHETFEISSLSKFSSFLDGFKVPAVSCIGSAAKKGKHVKNCSAEGGWSVRKQWRQPHLLDMNVKGVSCQYKEDGVWHSWDLFAMQKYDVVSAGMGALTVTSYFVWRGQEPMTALSITLAATVTALV